MNRLAITFLLSLCFLFFKGSGHLLANTDVDGDSHASVNASEEAPPADLGFVIYSPNLIPGTDLLLAAHHMLKATEVDEDEESGYESSRKIEQKHNYLTSFSYDQAADAFYLPNLNPLSFFKQSSKIASCRYLLHRVIRI